MIKIIYLALALSLIIISLFLKNVINKLPSDLEQNKIFKQLFSLFMTIGCISLLCFILIICKLSFVSNPFIPFALIIILLLGSMILGFKLAKAFKK